MIYTVEEIRRRITSVAVRYRLKAVYLFGSYARGEATDESDIDFLIDTSGTPLKGLFALGAVYCDLEDALQKKIDLITTSALEQRAQVPSDITFRENVARERVKLYPFA